MRRSKSPKQRKLRTHPVRNRRHASTAISAPCADVAAEAAKAAYARRWRRDANGWIIRDDELDLATLTGDALVAHRDRLTEHLDGLVEAGFVDGTLSEAKHDGYCYYEGDEDDPKVGVCLPDCPVAIARQQAYIATAYREHPGQLSLFSP